MPTATQNGITLHYRFDGDEGAPVVLLCNSLATDLGMWEPQVPALTHAGYRVLRYDRRGHGKSAVPPAPYTLEQLADDAVGLLDTLGLARVHFCGLSIGGMVGQILGAEHGARLLSLTLCDTAAHTPAPAAWDERMAAVRAGGMAAVVDATIERWFTPPGRQRQPQVIQRVREMILNTPVEGYCGCGAAIQRLDNRERLGRIRVPTTVIVGEEDQGTPVAAARFIHERVPGSTLTVLPRAAHLANLEQAPAFNDALLKHVQAHSGT
jgi:3-oxoadipate enol-lactonase